MSADDTATVRVTNLSEETKEQDLRDLFGHFGPIHRVYLAKDKTMQRSKVYSNLRTRIHHRVLLVLPASSKRVWLPCHIQILVADTDQRLVK